MSASTKIETPGPMFSIPWRSIKFSAIFIVLNLFIWDQWVRYLLPSWTELLTVGPEQIFITNAGFVWIPFITYLLASAWVCVGLNIVRKLKPYKEKGLIRSLVDGLITAGLVLGLIGGLIGGIFVGLIGGLIGGLIVGLIVGFIGGLDMGFSNEFTDPTE